jgi:hypothetical protein
MFVPQATQVIQAQAMTESVAEFARTRQPVRERMEAIEHPTDVAMAQP